jgi:hypothetical protein
MELNINLDTVEDIKDLPTGNYTGVIADATFAKTKGGNGKDPSPYVRFAFRASQALDGQDLEGVELNRMVYSADQFLTTKALPIFKKRMNESGLAPAGDLKDWAESLLGTEVRFTVGYETRTKADGSEIKNLRVTSFKKAA